MHYEMGSKIDHFSIFEKSNAKISKKFLQIFAKIGPLLELFFGPKVKICSACAEVHKQCYKASLTASFAVRGCTCV